MPTINFLRERRRKLTKQQLVDKQLYKVGLIVFGVSAALLVVASGARLTVAYLINQATQRQNNLMLIIKEQESNERAYLVFSAKLRTLVELLAKRQDKQEAITFFSTVFGQGVLVSNVTYQGDKSLLTFGLQAADVFTLERVIDTLKSEQVKSQFESVTTDALSRNDKGEYQTTVTVTLGSAASPSPSPVARPTSTTP